MAKQVTKTIFVSNGATTMMALLVSRLVRELLSRLDCYTRVVLVRRVRASAAERVIAAWRTTAQYSRVVTQKARVT